LGTPFMTPVIPRKWSDFHNSIIRVPTIFRGQKTSGISRVQSKKVPLEEKGE
jgi:spore germination protein KA